MKCTPIAAGANGRVALRRRGTVRRSPPRKGRPCRGLEDWRFGASWCAAVLLVCPELRYQSVQSVESAAVPTTAPVVASNPIDLVSEVLGNDGWELISIQDLRRI